MGNQCTPRSCQRSTPNPQNMKKAPPAIGIRSSRQISLTPINKESEGANTQAFANFVSCQNGSDLEKSQCSFTTKTKNYLIAKDTSQTQTIKDYILQNIETQPTLGDVGKKSLKLEADQKLNYSALSKRNIKVNIETPSQIRDSVVSAWNKSNFHESELMKTIKYEELFMPIIENNTFHKK